MTEMVPTSEAGGVALCEADLLGEPALLRDCVGEPTLEGLLDALKEALVDGEKDAVPEVAGVPLPLPLSVGVWLVSPVGEAATVPVAATVHDWLIVADSDTVKDAAKVEELAGLREPPRLGVPVAEEEMEGVVEGVATGENEGDACVHATFTNITRNMIERGPSGAMCTRFCEKTGEARDDLNLKTRGTGSRLEEPPRLSLSSGSAIASSTHESVSNAGLKRGGGCE